MPWVSDCFLSKDWKNFRRSVVPAAPALRPPAGWKRLWRGFFASHVNVCPSRGRYWWWSGESGRALHDVHLDDDEDVAKMGYPDYCAELK